MNPAPVRPSPRLGGQGLFAAAGLIAVITIAARAAGLARWVVFSSTVGTTCVGQVYATANTVPNVLFEIAAGGALAAVAIPLVARHLQRGDEELADRTASALMTWTLTLLLPLAALVALLAGPITALLLHRVEGCSPDDALAAGRLMLVLFAPQVVLYGVGIVLSGVLQSHRRFAAAALAPLLSSLVVIGVYLVFGALHDPNEPLSSIPTDLLVLLAGGTTLGVVALSLPLLGPTLRMGVRWRPTWRFPAGSGRLAGALAMAGLAAVGAQQLTVVVVLMLTNSTGVAGITVWNYAQTAYLLPYAVLVVPLATAAFPSLTGPRATALPMLRRSLTAAVVAAVSGAIALIAVRREVGALFLQLDRGADGPGRVTLEALPATLGWLAPGMVGYALLAVLTRALYAVGQPRRAAGAAVLGWAVAGLVPVLLVSSMEQVSIDRVLVALALGSTVGMSLTGLVLVLDVARVWGPDSVSGLWRAGLVAGAGAGAVLLVRELWGPSDVAGWGPALGWGTLTGLCTLGGAVLMLRLLGGEAWKVVGARLGTNVARRSDR